MGGTLLSQSRLVRGWKKLVFCSPRGLWTEASAQDLHTAAPSNLQARLHVSADTAEAQPHTDTVFKSEQASEWISAATSCKQVLLQSLLLWPAERDQ